MTDSAVTLLAIVHDEATHASHLLALWSIITKEGREPTSAELSLLAATVPNVRLRLWAMIGPVV